MSRKSNIFKLMNSTFWDLPCSSNMSYFWNFGSMLGLCLSTQILSGFILTFFYTSFFTESFFSVNYLSKEIWWGWLIRLFHMNGASLFFFFLFIHIFRGMYFFSSKMKSVWFSGIMIMILLMMTSFLGYVLPWGQMSYWAVAVITNLFSIIPVLGKNLVLWIWGGFSVDKPTLMRFYSLHFLTPMIILLATVIHLGSLHSKGSSNSMGLNSNMDKINFHPYFTFKDKLFIISIYLIMLTLVCLNPLVTLDPTNNIPANPMQTPVHIQPEWYFLTFYAILRSLPSKTTGVLGLASSIIILFFLSFFKFKMSPKFNMIRILMFWLTFTSFIVLMKLGSLPAEEPFVLMGKIWTTTYFMTLIFLNL